MAPSVSLPSAIASRSDERGMALVAVLLLLMMMSALAAALAVSGRTETLVARNHQSAAQARAAAEAGLNHGVQAAVAYISTIAPANVPGALDTLLANPSVLPGITLGGSIPIAGAADPDARYEVSVVDDDDVADDDPMFDEDGNPLNDNNATLIVRAIGHAQGNTTVTLEAVIGPIRLPAILTNGELIISGNADIKGDAGSVHSNGDLTISGSPSIEGYATASGTYTETGNPDIDGKSGGGNAVLAIPPISAAGYREQADLILESDGTITDQDDVVLCTSGDKACHGTYGWTLTGADRWDLTGDSPIEGAYFVEGDVKITGNVAPHGDPPQVTIFATGSIEILGGSPDFQPAANAGGILFVTDGDLKLSANLHVPASAGKILVREQLEITGNADVLGQIFVEDAADDHDLVTESTISGSAKIEYDGGLDSNNFIVHGWREVR